MDTVVEDVERFTSKNTSKELHTPAVMEKISNVIPDGVNEQKIVNINNLKLSDVPKDVVIDVEAKTEEGRSNKKILQNFH